jgi:hypothetical protein
MAGNGPERAGHGVDPLDCIVIEERIARRIQKEIDALDSLRPAFKPLFFNGNMAGVVSAIP